MNRRTLVVNLYGGPGAGKSTMAARVFAELKELGRSVELVPEYAKDQVWGETTRTLDNQLYVFAKQYHRTWRVMGKVDVIVTDSPLFLSTIYGTTTDTFKSLVYEEINKMDRLDIYLNRAKVYNPEGRLQTESEAKEIDNRLWDDYKAAGYQFDLVVPGNKMSTTLIVKKILDWL